MPRTDAVADVSPNDDSSPRVTRRDLLRAGAVVGTLGVAGGTGFTLAYDRALPTAPSPKSGTWPLARYGPRNTARSSDATPPTDPTVRSVPTAENARNVVVGGSGSDRCVLVGGYDGLTTHEPDGTERWTNGEGHVVAIRPGTTTGYAAGGAGFRAFDLADGDVHWRADWQEGFAVVPTSRGTLVPFNGGIASYDDAGDRRFTIRRGDGVGNAGAAVGDGVYVTDVGMVERLRPRAFVRSFRGKPPKAAWRVERDLGFASVPALADGELYVPDEGRGTGGLLSLSTDGSVRWDRELGMYPAGLALGPDRAFLSMVQGDVHSGEDRLYALDRSDGATAWSDAIDGFYDTPVVAGDTVVVGGERPDETGFVRAFTRDGDRLWTVDASSHVHDVVPVGDRVYAVSRDGQLHVLS